MAGLSFRPRQIDIDRPLPIFRREMEGEQSLAMISRSVPEFSTGMEKEEEHERHLQAVLNTWHIRNEGNVAEVPSVEIPTPRVVVVPEYDADTSLTFNRPPGYVKWNEGMPQCLDYDIDSADESFIERLQREENVSLTPQDFETIVDAIERYLINKAPPSSSSSSSSSASGGGGATQNPTSIPHPHVLFDLQSVAIGEQELVSQLSKELKSETHRRAIGPVYRYLSAKRQQEARDTQTSALNPYLYHWLRPTDPEDPSPLRAFRIRPEDMRDRRRVRRNDASTLARLRELRREMEKARTLLEMITRRERLKKDRMENLEALYEFRLLELQNVLDNPDAPDSFVFDEASFELQQQQQQLLLQQQLELESLLLPASSTDADSFAIDDMRQSMFGVPEKRKKQPRESRPSSEKKRIREKAISTRMHEEFLTPFTWSDDVDDDLLLSSDSDTDADNDLAMQYSYIPFIASAMDERYIDDSDLTQQHQPEEEMTDESTAILAPPYLQELGFTKPLQAQLATTGAVRLPDVAPFRGRARVGRGGRLVFDRRSFASHPQDFSDDEEVTDPR
jgi:hypothetical protein